MRLRCCLNLVALLMLLPLASHAQSLPQPQGPVLLTVTGQIASTNTPGEAQFDKEMLKQVGWATVNSYTAWTEGRHSFSGVPLQALLDHLGARGETIRAIALNDYSAEVPRSDAAAYDVLLALEVDGVPMRVRDKGPIWIIYPSSVPQTEDIGQHNDKMVWQLKALDVR